MSTARGDYRSVGFSEFDASFIQPIREPFSWIPRFGPSGEFFVLFCFRSVGFVAGRRMVLRVTLEKEGIALGTHGNVQRLYFLHRGRTLTIMQPREKHSAHSHFHFGHRVYFETVLRRWSLCYAAVSQLGFPNTILVLHHTGTFTRRYPSVSLSHRLRAWIIRYRFY